MLRKFYRGLAIDFLTLTSCKYPKTSVFLLILVWPLSTCSLSLLHLIALDDTCPSIWLLWMSDRPVEETFSWLGTTHTRRTSTPTAGFELLFPSKRVAADSRLRPRGQQDQPWILLFLIFVTHSFPFLMIVIITSYLYTSESNTVLELSLLCPSPFAQKLVTIVSTCWTECGCKLSYRVHCIQSIVDVITWAQHVREIGSVIHCSIIYRLLFIHSASRLRSI